MGTFGDGERKKRKAQADARENEPAGFRGFVNVNLSEQQKAEFRAWYGTADIPALFALRCTQGIVLSLKWDGVQQCFQASGTQRSNLSVNGGLAVTARSTEPEIALGRLLFMLDLLGDGDWTQSKFAASEDRW